MNQQRQTAAIILTRTDFGEADRILTVLTPEQGKLRLMAKGVRRAKSKLAGGIELFSISQLTYIPGRGEIGTLVSTQLDKHYGRIVQDIQRTMLGYELIKQLHRNTEDSPEPDYFDLLQMAFASLDEPELSSDLIEAWFVSQLIRLAGHTPNLRTDTAGAALATGQAYNFDLEAMTFQPHPDGGFGANHIKLLRLLFSSTQPAVIQKVQGLAELLIDVRPLLRTMAQTQLRP